MFKIIHRRIKIKFIFELSTLVTVITIKLGYYK